MSNQEKFENWMRSFDPDQSLTLAAEYPFYASYMTCMAVEAFESRQSEIDSLKQKVLEFEGAYDGCEKANEYNKAVIKRLGEMMDAVETEMKLAQASERKAAENNVKLIEENLRLKAEVNHSKAMAEDSMSSTYWKLEALETEVRHFEEETIRLKADNERLRNAAKPVIDYWFEEDLNKTHEDDNRAFLELSNAYYRRVNTTVVK